MSATLAPDHVLQQMQEVWRDLGGQGVEEDGTAVLRACSMTLVVVAAEDEDTTPVSETLAALLPEHPARTILIVRGPELSARVTAQCWKPLGQNRKICCESIEIAAPEGSFQDVASVIDPIAAPDLPLVIWCRCRRSFGASDFGALGQLANRVIVDSLPWQDGRGSVKQLAETSGRGVVLGDLTWTRLTRWREMLGQVFENQRYATRIPAITRVHIGYTGESETSIALYMGAWIRNAIQDAGGKPELTFGPEAAGQLVSVELTGADIHVKLARQDERLAVTVDGATHCTNLSQPSDYLNLREELGIMGADPIFERTLASAAKL